MVARVLTALAWVLLSLSYHGHATALTSTDQQSETLRALIEKLEDSHYVDRRYDDAMSREGSPYPAPLRMDEAKQIALAHKMRAELGLSGGQLVANPIPLGDQIPQSEIDPVIAEALTEAAQQKITAKAVTPFLLSRVFDMTQGRSLTANIALVLNNARLAAQIAQNL